MDYDTNALSWCQVSLSSQPSSGHNNNGREAGGVKNHSRMCEERRRWNLLVSTWTCFGAVVRSTEKYLKLLFVSTGLGARTFVNIQTNWLASRTGGPRNSTKTSPARKRRAAAWVWRLRQIEDASELRQGLNTFGLKVDLFFLNGGAPIIASECRREWPLLYRESVGVSLENEINSSLVGGDTKSTNQVVLLRHFHFLSRSLQLQYY